MGLCQVSHLLIYQALACSTDLLNNLLLVLSGEAILLDGRLQLTPARFNQFGRDMGVYVFDPVFDDDLLMMRLRFTFSAYGESESFLYCIYMPAIDRSLSLSLLCVYMPAIDRPLSLSLLCVYMPAIDRSLSDCRWIRG